ncbi:TPA: type-F conjugative transfer system pilin assembly protein TrbC, partial [Burkholderia cenocepacia]
MSRLTFSIIAAGTIALAAGHVSAQTVSNDALAREQQQINTTRRAIFDEAASGTARYRGVMPSSDAIDAEMSRIQRSRDRQMAQAAAKAAHDGNA